MGVSDKIKRFLFLSLDRRPHAPRDVFFFDPETYSCALCVCSVAAVQARKKSEVCVGGLCPTSLFFTASLCLSAAADPALHA